MEDNQYAIEGCITMHLTSDFLTTFSLLVICLTPDSTVNSTCLCLRFKYSVRLVPEISH